MKYFFLPLVRVCLVAAVCTCSLSAQDKSTQNIETAKKEVVALIQQMFEGMKAGDSAKVSATFHSAAALHTTSLRDGKPVFRTESVADFLKSIATPKPAGVVYDERILRYDVQIDDAFASVWTPYQFYIGDKLNHCGVNAFHCVRTEQGWKITHITDTRRKDRCQ
jgi:hypothetical protein